MVKKEDLDSIVVNSAVLEELFGVGDRMIRYLAEQGIAVKTSHGKYLLKKSVKNYIIALKASGTENDVTGEDGENLNLKAEQAAHERVKRQLAEIRLQLSRRQVHKAEDVETIMTDMLARFKERIVAIPAKMAQVLEGKDKEEIQSLLRRETNQALAELSEYNPADFSPDGQGDDTEQLLKVVKDGSLEDGHANEENGAVPKAEGTADGK